MTTSFDKLLQVASDPIGKVLSEDDIFILVNELNAPREVVDVILRRNGFYAFESSLHFFHFGRGSQVLDLSCWNSIDCWKGLYNFSFENLHFFAEDVFGVQFCLSEGNVYSFDPETADLEHISNSLEGWFDKLLTNYNVMTGYSLAHEWQITHGPLLPGHRLIPKIPFVAGGKYELSNLYSCESVKAMRFRAEFANQIKGLPDRSKIRIRIK